MRGQATGGEKRRWHNLKPVFRGQCGLGYATYIEGGVSERAGGQARGWKPSERVAGMMP